MLLSDEQIVLALSPRPEECRHPIVTGIERPGDWYSKDSPVQPASLDLRIGEILIPGKHGEEPGAARHPVKEYVLKCGQTALVKTLEKIDLPNDMVAVGFPPSTAVSSRGLLMTNPGQVDPGYVGKMHFTVINMAKEPYQLRERDPIVSLIFLKLQPHARAGWQERHDGASPQDDLQERLDRLSHDFLDVEKRAADIADAKVRSMIGLSALVSGLAAFFLTFVGIWLGQYLHPGWVGPIAQLETDVALLQAKQDSQNVLPRIVKLEEFMRQQEATKSGLHGRRGARPTSRQGRAVARARNE